MTKNYFSPRFCNLCGLKSRKPQIPGVYTRSNLFWLKLTCQILEMMNKRTVKINNPSAALQNNPSKLQWWTQNLIIRQGDGPLPFALLHGLFWAFVLVNELQIFCLDGVRQSIVAPLLSELKDHNKSTVENVSVMKFKLKKKWEILKFLCICWISFMQDGILEIIA